MTRMLALCGSLLAAYLVGCTLVPPKPVEPPAPPQALESCVAFCDLYVRIGCDSTGDSPGQDGIEGNADDITCATVCADEVEAGGYTPDRVCLDTASTCEEAEACVFGAQSAQAPSRQQGLRGVL